MGKTTVVPAVIDGMPLAYKYTDVKIAVIRGEEPDYKTIQLGMQVQLVSEPNNPYDSKAIAIVTNGVRLGYLYKGWMQDMANDFIRGEQPIYSVISGLNKKENIIEIFLGFYRD